MNNILFSFIIFFASHQLLCDLAATDMRACGRLQLEKIELDAALWLQTRTVRNSPEDLTISVQMAVLFVWDGTITVQSPLPATIFFSTIFFLSAKQKDGLKTNTEEQ